MNIISETKNNQGITTHKAESPGVIDNTPKPIRVITKRSFMQRFDQVERIAIRNSTDDIVIDIYEDLKMTSSVDLDLQDTIDAVNYLNANGYLTVKTVPELLTDGTQAEQYP